MLCLTGRNRTSFLLESVSLSLLYLLHSCQQRNGQAFFKQNQSIEGRVAITMKNMVVDTFCVFSSDLLSMYEVHIVCSGHVSLV